MTSPAERQRGDHERRALAWFGLTPASTRPCPRTLAGRRHIELDRGICICDNRVLDHPRRWTDREGRPVVTAEPYGQDGESLADLLRELAELGLTVLVDGRSPYYPGSTILILMRRKP